MNMKRHPVFPLWTLALLFALLLGCNRPQNNVTVTAAPVALVSPQDFDLSTVVGLLRQGVSDGPSLEAQINAPNTGINNVDTDKDGKIDYVSVIEAPIPAGKKMELVAHASSNTLPDTSIAAIRFAQEPTGVDVQAGFAPQFDPAGTYYYRDTLGTDLMFAQWLFMPSRPLYVAPMPVGFAFRSRLPPAAVQQTRTTFTTTTRVSPVVNQPRPASFNAGRLTTLPSNAAAPRQPATTLGGAANGVSDFKATSNAPKPAGVGFGAAPAARPAPAAAPAARPSPSPAPVSRPSSSLSSGRKR